MLLHLIKDRKKYNTVDGRVWHPLTTHTLSHSELSKYYGYLSHISEKSLVHPIKFF